MPLLRDLRYSTRALARRPLFTVAAILSIAIGIGGATGIYSVFDAVVLRPLPFDQPRRLVQASLLKEDGRGGGPWSFDQFEAYRRSAGAFEALSARTYLPVTVTATDRAEIVQSELVTADYFRALRVAPIRGRLFGDSEDDVAVISHQLQELWFGDGAEVQVVGVIEDVMYDTIRSEPTPMLLRPVEQVWSSQVGFLLRGAGAAESLMPSVRDVVRSVDPDLPVLDLVPTEVQYDNAVHRNRSLALLFTVVAAGGLLLAACGVFGVVSYVVGRRHRELAVRRVLGADTLRVIRLVLRGTMTAVLAGLVAGLGAGLLLARVLSRFLFGIPPGDPLTFAAVSAFLLLVSSLAALLPTRQAVRLDPAASLRQD